MQGLVHTSAGNTQAVPNCSQVCKVSGRDAKVVVFVGSAAAGPVCSVATCSKAAGRPTVTVPAPTATVSATTAAVGATTAAVAAPASVIASAVAPARW